MTLQELKDTALRMQNYLEIKVTEDPSAILERMENLQVLIARSGKMLADAKFLQDRSRIEAIREVIKDESYNSKSATFINKYIESSGQEVNHLVNWFDRINSTAGKQHQGLITMLSFIKSQMNMT